VTRGWKVLARALRAPGPSVGRSCERGQALAEFLVAAAVLVPLFAAVVLVGRMQDVRSHVQESARYAAFAAALGHPPAGRVASEVRERFFGDPEAPLLVGVRSPKPEEINAHWRDLASDAPLLARASDVEVWLEERRPAGAAAQALDVALAAADAAGRLTGGRLDLERAGFHTAQVTARLATTAMLEQLGVKAPVLRARAGVLGDSWASTGPAQASGRSAALVPAAQLRELRPLFAPISWALSLLEPAFARLCLGRVDAELVPEDRLGVPGSGDAGSWVAPCH
jgi:hypothetical protein